MDFFKRTALSAVLFSILCTAAFAQSGIIRGTVSDANTNETLPSANVVIQGTQKFASADFDGKFEIKELKPGLYNLEVSFIGYKSTVIYEVEVTNARPAIANIALKPDITEIEGVEIEATGFETVETSPLSLREIGQNEIKRNPGGNRDISRVIRSLPGVSPTVAFRNDVIIRGGSPNENRFYLDGIEVPNINHFATQGASGGPVGLINVDFIENVEFYSGAFPANRGNALSSVLEFTQKEGRQDKWTANAVLGASDLGVTFEGPISKKSSLIFSARRSYLQFLFRLLELPFLPIYNDFQFKYKHNFDQKNELTLIGLGAIDNFELNTDANETPEQRYVLNNLPVNEQWNYTLGAKYRRFHKEGGYTFVLSRNHLNNTAIKYEGNDNSTEDNLILNYESQEIETKFRFEDDRFKGSWTFNYGVGLEQARYTNSTFNRRATPQGVQTFDFDSDLTFGKYGLFGQVSKRLLDERLLLSLGVRTDFTDYSEKLGNPLEQLSPRFSLSYTLTPALSFNFNTGIFYQLPAYTILGYRNSENELENKERVNYIENQHLVAGFSYLLGRNTKFSLEGFYKKYNDYPFSLTDSVSLANLGGDFGVIGNEPVASVSEGRSYGLEVLTQQKLTKGFYGIMAYTFVRSEFQDLNGNFVPSSWDSRHIISLTGGKKFGKNWEIGLRWLFSSGTPFTPFDVEATVLRENWDVRGQGIPDYSRVNSERTGAFHQLDFRIDKKYFFKKWSLNVFFDIQNAYGFAVSLQDFIDIRRDDQGNGLINPNNPNAYQFDFLNNESGTTLPTLGIILEIG